MTLLQALTLAEKLEKSHIKVLKWFIENGQFEGSYRELSTAIYGKPKVASNVNKYVRHLAEIRLLVVVVNDDCNCFDVNRTCIYVNPDWK